MSNPPNTGLLILLAVFAGIGIIAAVIISIKAFITRPKKIIAAPKDETTVEKPIDDEKAKAAEAAADRRGKAINTSVGQKGSRLVTSVNKNPKNKVNETPVDHDQEKKTDDTSVHEEDK